MATDPRLVVVKGERQTRDLMLARRATDERFRRWDAELRAKILRAREGLALEALSRR
jgi:hypothetical protein